MGYDTGWSQLALSVVAALMLGCGVYGTASNGGTGTGTSSAGQDDDASSGADAEPCDPVACDSHCQSMGPCGWDGSPGSCDPLLGCVCERDLACEVTGNEWDETDTSATDDTETYDWDDGYEWESGDGDGDSDEVDDGWFDPDVAPWPLQCAAEDVESPPGPPCSDAGQCPSVQHCWWPADIWEGAQGVCENAASDDATRLTGRVVDLGSLGIVPCVEVEFMSGAAITQGLVGAPVVAAAGTTDSQGAFSIWSPGALDAAEGLYAHVTGPDRVPTLTWVASADAGGDYPSINERRDTFSIQNVTAAALNQVLAQDPDFGPVLPLESHGAMFGIVRNELGARIVGARVRPVVAGSPAKVRYPTTTGPGNGYTSNLGAFVLIDAIPGETFEAYIPTDTGTSGVPFVARTVPGAFVSASLVLPELEGP